MNPAENPIENPDARRKYLPPRLEGCSSGNRHVGYENRHGINILRVTGTGINPFHYLAKDPITSRYSVRGTLSSAAKTVEDRQSGVQWKATSLGHFPSLVVIPSIRTRATD